MNASQLELVFRLELPLELAPTMNVYSSLKRTKWKLGKMNEAVDTRILQAKARWPRWKMSDLVVQRTHRFVDIRTKDGRTKRVLREYQQRTGGRRRLVVVHRYTRRAPDEVACDIIGGKLPIDRLMQAEVLRDDNARWCAREAHVHPANAGAGRVVIEVYDLTPRAGAL